MSIDAVALLRIPGFTPPEEADVRELDDGFLLFLAQPWETPHEALLEAIDDVVGEALFGHAEMRGIFVFPDTAEPEEATTYEQVLAAVGEEGQFISLGAEAMTAPDEMLGQMLEALGVGSAGEIMKALQSGDEDALKMAQIQMMSAMERAMAGGPPMNANDTEAHDAEFDDPDAPEAAKVAGAVEKKPS